MVNVLIDTNVLVYAYDRGEFSKQSQAIEVLNALQVTGAGRLSVQCLAEFFNATTRGAFPKLSVTDAIEQMKYLAGSFKIYELSPMIVMEAARGVQAYQLSYFDAQIWASARLNQESVIFSEDFSVGSTLEGVRFINPFDTNFTLHEWI